MLSLVDLTTLASHSKLFEHFLVTLNYQLFSFENDLFHVSLLCLLLKIDALYDIMD